MDKYDELTKIWESDKKHSHWKTSFGEESWLSLSKEYGKIFNYFFSKYDFKKDKVLDFGSGGGCNSLNIYPLCKEYNAVDISTNNLKEFESTMVSLNYKNYNLINYDPNHIDYIRTRVSNIDFIFSTAVFQHFPSFDFSQKILQEFSSIITNDGYIIIQYRESEKDMEAENYSQGLNYIFGLSFTDKKIKEQLEVAGFDLLELKKFEKPSKTYKWLIAKKKK